jgi:hypothetical protein
VIIDRAVFYRENASRTYNSMAYAITMIIVEWPFCLAAAVLYVYALSLSLHTTPRSHARARHNTTRS